MTLEDILGAAKRKVGRVGQYAVLGLTLAFGACGDGNVPAGEEEETCEVRETERCEDFTGLYKIMNYEEFLECTMYRDDPDDHATWVRGEYISMVTYDGRCGAGVVNHPLPDEIRVVTDASGGSGPDADNFTSPCSGLTIAKGNHLYDEWPGDRGGLMEIVKCGNQAILRVEMKKWHPLCTAELSLVEGKDPVWYPTWSGTCE